MGMKPRDHNARVYALAGRMPRNMLRHAVCAIGYAANYDTGITSGFSVKTLASESMKRFNGAEHISARQLTRAINILRNAGALEVTRAPTVDGRKQPSVYRLVWDYDDAGKLASGYASFREARKTEVAKTKRPSITPEGINKQAKPLEQSSREQPEAVPMVMRPVRVLKVNGKRLVIEDPEWIASLDDYPEPPDAPKPVEVPEPKPEDDPWKCEGPCDHWIHQQPKVDPADEVPPF